MSNMSIELAIAILSGLFALLATVLAIYGQRMNTNLAHELALLKLNRQEEKEVSRYKEPLIRAAYDLQSRLYNILSMNLLELYYKYSGGRERNYVIESTLFLIAQYFCWTEIIRNEIQFIDLGEDEKTKKLSDLLNKISQTFLTNEYGNAFRVFTGEQRALGEIMIKKSETERNQCKGYNQFKKEFMIVNDEPIFEYLKNDIEVASEDPKEVFERLTLIQNHLIDLIDYLDPNYIRYPKDLRKKITLNKTTP